MFLFTRAWRKVFFSEMNPIIALGATRSLQPGDFPKLPELLEPTTVCLDESKIDWSTGPKLLKSLLGASKRYWMFPLGLYLLNGLLNLSGPVFVNLFVKRLQTGVVYQSALIEALLYGLAIGFSGIFAGLCIQHYFYGHLRIMQIFMNVVNTKIFQHSLRLSKSAREKTPIGDIVNHMSTDTDSVAETSNALSDLIYCTFMIVGAVSMLFYYIGSTAWVALILLSVLAPITRKVSRDFTRFDEDLMKHRDRRVTLMSQLLTAVRLVKYFVWEKSVSEEVHRIRAEELYSRRRIARAELLVTLIYVSVGTLVLFAVLAVHSVRGGTMDAALIFTCVSLFALLEDPFAFISRVISHFISAKVGADRIAKFLAQPVTEESTGNENADIRPYGFTMENLSVHLGEARHPSLIDVSLKLAPGRSLAVVGPVGSGKSTFIHALLGEVEKSSGSLKFFATDGEEHRQCRIGYVPQEAYILNGTLRENITFGREDIPEAQVQRALELAGLWQDVQALAGGLNAELGEKGINLSGGQRQRLSLARAVVHEPQLVILDDPLSAVDSNTEGYLAHHLLFGEWKNVTKVVITHRLTHLSQFDQIVFLEAGRVKGYGTFDELMGTCAEFRSYLDEYGRSQISAGVQETQKELTVSASNGESSRITDDEDRAYGAVHGGVYWDYIKSLGGENVKLRPLILLLLFAAAASGTVFPLLQKSWLAFVSNTQSGQTSWLAGTVVESFAKVPLTAIYIYGGLGLLVMAATLWADLYWLRRGLIAGRNIHDRMLSSILGATTRFFDSTPVGRVLQRFSRDMEAIDIHLQWSFEHSMKCAAQVLVTLMLILSVLPVVGLFIAPVLYFYYRAQKLYRASAREAKRLDSISRSPRYAHFKETLQGLTVIRAFGKTDWFLQEFYKRLSYHQRMFHGHYMVNRWFSTRIPVLGGLVSLFTAVGIVISVRSGAITPGMAGLLTIYSLSFWGVLNWGIRIWAEVEARMTSMERVKFYSRLPQERSVVKPEVAPDVVWPVNGEVRFEDVVVRYAEHLPQVLKGLSFHVPAGTKVGIIGRTGSGKSTLFQTLFRFIELESGRILIDGVDIATIPQARLRKALAIIPQDPTLFMGALRMNLDRYSEFSDAELWTVLERTCLGDMVRALPRGLQTELTENGANFSQGQRQLLCLARALLLKAKVIILDEATASVDVKTDAQVQKIVRESCQGVTMLIIAHRLGTVRDCDQIIEISEGRLRRNIHPGKSQVIDLELEPSMIEAGK